MPAFQDNIDFGYWVECSTCGIRTSREDTREEAIAAWNRRTAGSFRPALPITASEIVSGYSDSPSQVSDKPAPAGGSVGVEELLDDIELAILQIGDGDQVSPLVGAWKLNSLLRRTAAALRAHVGKPGDGVALISAERKRQVEREGWTTAHDDTHDDGELAEAAAMYVSLPQRRRVTDAVVMANVSWPFGSCDWKPGDRIRELSKAGALIAAEIDRLQRAAPPTPKPSHDAGRGDGME